MERVIVHTEYSNWVLIAHFSLPFSVKPLLNVAWEFCETEELVFGGPPTAKRHYLPGRGAGALLSILPQAVLSRALAIISGVLVC